MAGPAHEERQAVHLMSTGTVAPYHLSSQKQEAMTAQRNNSNSNNTNNGNKSGMTTYENTRVQLARGHHDSLVFLRSNSLCKYEI